MSTETESEICGPISVKAIEALLEERQALRAALAADQAAVGEAIAIAKALMSEKKRLDHELQHARQQLALMEAEARRRPKAEPVQRTFLNRDASGAVISADLYK